MVNENGKHSESEDEYIFNKVEDGKRPKCISCGDPAKMVIHSGGVPMAAAHCKDCYAELRWGKIPKYKRRRNVL